MNGKLPISEQLKTKYHKCEEVNSLKEMIYRSARNYSNRVAFKLKNEDGKIYSKTYSELLKDIEAVGEYLIEKGLKNKRIAIIGKNSYQWAISYIAATIVGVVVPIDKELHCDDVINFMNISETECILGYNKNLNPIIENIEQINNKETIFVSFDNKKDTKKYLSFNTILKQGNDLCKAGITKFEKIEVDPDEMKILLFTSGTTGNAKGVCLSHRNVCSNILSIYGIVKVKKSDLFFSILPLHHTYECTIGFLLPLYSGASICYCDGLRYISNNILEYQPSVILCVPLLLEKIHKKILKKMETSLPRKYTENENIFDNLPLLLKTIVRKKVKKSLGGRLRVFIIGAAPVDPEIGNLFDKLHINSLQGYGLTECAPLVSGNTDFYKRNDSPGLPIPNVEYKIDKPNEEGVGEIIVKGPNVMLGYYNMREETNKVIIDGWFHTGDLGKINDDGYLFITGRCKSVIITKNGKNIYSEEIESHLHESPFVAEALVLGKQKNKGDEVYVNAFIYPNIDAIKEKLKSKKVTEKEIEDIISKVITNVNSKMPNYKHIKKFIIRDTAFEKTTTQKIKRYGINVEDNLKLKIIDSE